MGWFNHQLPRLYRDSFHKPITRIPVWTDQYNERCSYDSYVMCFFVWTNAIYVKEIPRRLRRRLTLIFHSPRRCAKALGKANVFFWILPRQVSHGLKNECSIHEHVFVYYTYILFIYIDISCVYIYTYLALSSKLIDYPERTQQLFCSLNILLLASGVKNNPKPSSFLDCPAILPILQRKKTHVFSG